MAHGGDANGDGIEELILGAPADQLPGDPGRIVIVDLGGQTLYEIDGWEPGGHLGMAVAGGFDLTADQIPDIIVGAPGEAGQPGRVYLIEGQRLFLMAVPHDISPVSPRVNFTSRRGQPGLPVLLVLTQVNGTPLFQSLLPAGLFDSTGTWQRGGTIPAPPPPGSVVEFRILSLDASGHTILSNGAQIEFP